RRGEGSRRADRERRRRTPLIWRAHSGVVTLSCMTRGRLFAIASVFAVLAPAGAAAAPKDPSGKSTPLQLHKDEPGGNDGTVARSRARSGDCAGALPSFDAAIRTTIEPTLRRD